MPTDLERYRKENELFQAGDIDGLEGLIQEAVDRGDVKSLASLVPAHYHLLCLLDRRACVLQAIDDWRIAYLKGGAIWQLEGYGSSLEYFREIATTGDLMHRPTTRQTYANAIQVFMVELGWTLEEMTMAGIGKMANHYSFAREHSQEHGGEMDPDLKSLFLDSDNISSARLRGVYESTLRGEEITEDDLGDPDDEERDGVPPAWRPYVSAIPRNGGIELTVWERIPDRVGDKWVSRELGVLYAHDELQVENAGKFLAGEIPLKGWWKDG